MAIVTSVDGDGGGGRKDGESSTGFDDEGQGGEEGMCTRRLVSLESAREMRGLETPHLGQCGAQSPEIAAGALTSVVRDWVGE